MKHTEIENRCDEKEVHRTEIYPSGILESVIALWIMLGAIPVSAILVKGAIQILSLPASSEIQEVRK